MRHLAVSKEVEQALASGGAVVALESTVISHGLPWPDNLAVAKQLEAAVRSGGAVPATIALLHGTIRVGLDDAAMEMLAREAATVAKVNLSNMAAIVAKRALGSTTVAATMKIAAAAGIRVFATGGIGGVHRAAEHTFDISADMNALAAFPVAVVSAGAKAILDLPKTVELLETLGVPVLGWQTDEFPAFYRRESGLPVDARFDAMADLAAACEAHWDLGFAGGIVVANPVPREHELPRAVYEHALAKSLAEAEAAGISRRGVTPFLLAAMKKNSEGHSVFSNTALLEHNASVAAELATQLALSRTR